MLVRTLDLTNPIAELQNISMPSQVTSVANVPYKFNGAMVYTGDSNQRLYDAPWKTFLPRAGIAIRINDKTAVRAGYARYAVPWVTVHPETGGLPTNGFSQDTQILGPLQGTPRTQLSDPFPAGSSRDAMRHQAGRHAFRRGHRLLPGLEHGNDGVLKLFSVDAKNEGSESFANGFLRGFDLSFCLLGRVRLPARRPGRRRLVGPRPLPELRTDGRDVSRSGRGRTFRPAG